MSADETAPPGDGEPAATTALAVRNGPCAWTYRYDAAEDEAEYSRSFLDATRLAQVRASRPKTIEEIRRIVRTNITKETQEARGEAVAIDADIIHLVDISTNIPVFVAGDSVFTREELCAIHPFAALRTTPESVFAQQELGLFLPETEGDEPEMLARDLGDPSPFVRTRDLVRAATHGDVEPKPPDRIVKTKVFVGRDRWERFQKSCEMFAHFNDFIRPALSDGRDTLFSLADRVAEASPTLRLGDGRADSAPAGGSRAAPLLIGDGSDGSDLAKKEAALARREQELRERELALRERELALREAKLAVGE